MVYPSGIGRFSVILSSTEVQSFYFTTRMHTHTGGIFIRNVVPGVIFIKNVALVPLSLQNRCIDALDTAKSRHQGM